VRAVSEYDWLLLGHLLGAFLFVSGAVVAAVLQLAARGQRRTSEIATLLAAVRGGVLLVGVGAVLVLVFGIWLAEHVGYGLGEGWVLAALLLLAAGVVIGGAAGRFDRHTRELAQRLAGEGVEESDELSRRLRDPVAAALNWTSAALVVAIIVLMVWKP
jgi:uncharacterized membrane protein